MKANTSENLELGKCLEGVIFFWWGGGRILEDLRFFFWGGDLLEDLQ